MGKNSFIIYNSDLKGLEYLTDSQIGKLFRALAKLQLVGEEPSLGNNPALNILFGQIREHIAINEDRYKDICEKRTAAANKRWHSGVQKNANASESMQMHASGCLDDNDNDIDIDNDNDNDIDNVRDACGAKKQNKRNNYYGKNTPRLLRDEPTYDIDAFTRQAIGLKYEKKAPQGAVP